jgi:hypothetical protein
LDAILGYLNLSAGRPDARFEKEVNEVYGALAQENPDRPAKRLHELLRIRLDALKATGAGGFRDAAQAEAVLALVFEVLLPAYRHFHADLLAHQSDADLEQPFLVARAAEAVLLQGPPWGERERIVRAALGHLNDFVGYRPVAILESRPRGEPYAHERVRPVPLFIRGAGVAWGRYSDLVRGALDILAGTDPGLRADAALDLDLLDELALDPRAYDQSHPVNRRPNYIFGEWDPDLIDGDGRYRRFVVRQVTLDAILNRVEHPGELDPRELLFEASAVFAGTILMAAGTSGAGPGAHDSSASLETLIPHIARYRDAFYDGLLDTIAGKHGNRLRAEAAACRQAFGAARRHLNEYLARHRAFQLQQRHLAVFFADVGYPDAGRREAARIPAAPARFLSEIVSRLTTGHRLAERGLVDEAARVPPEIEDLLERGIACGAFVDPWNILGFQAMFPLSAAREDSMPDPRIEDLLMIVDGLFNLYTRLMSEAAGRGKDAVVQELSEAFGRRAAWWDRFASVEVGDVRRLSGAEATQAAASVARALGRWHERGQGHADLAFWREQLPGFHSPRAFALVVDALLRKGDLRSALGLLIAWVGAAEQVPLADGAVSFHALALRWMLAAVGAAAESATAGGSRAPDPALVRRFFDYLEANAEDYWQVPALVAELDEPRPHKDRDDLYSAAYEGVTYRDSAEDEQQGEVADGAAVREFDLESGSEEILKRLRFLSTLARLWQIAGLPRGSNTDPEHRAALARWRHAAQNNRYKLEVLLENLGQHPVPEPSGSYQSMVDYDRHRAVKQHLLVAAIATALDTHLAVALLRGATDDGSAGEPQADTLQWEPAARRLERALWQSDRAAVQAALADFVPAFQDEPLVFTALEDGGSPQDILRAQVAQALLRALVTNLPLLGLLRETYHLLQVSRAMERARPAAGISVSEFNVLFQDGFQAVIQNMTDAAESWRLGGVVDQELVALLEALTGPFLGLWIDYSRGVRLSSLESVREEADLKAQADFIRRYGHDLFQPRFMTLANLRGILLRGAGAYLDYLVENPDPLHPVLLVEELERQILRADAVRHLEGVLRALVENYEEYKDYNTSTTQSDYGENLHMLLDFLRLKAMYDRHSWQFRPLVLVHEVLARKERMRAAVLWEGAFRRLSGEVANRLLDELTRLEQAHGMRLRTVRDRLEERFVGALAVDRLCAGVGPALAEAHQGQTGPAFSRLETEVVAQASNPVGVGLDVPVWLRRLEQEVQRLRAARSSLAQMAEGFARVPQKLLSFADWQQQLQNWDKPLYQAGPGAEGASETEGTSGQ